MAQLGIAFNSQQVAPDTGRAEPFPEGRYLLHVINSDVKQSSSGKGTLLSLELEVYEGTYKGRRVFENINIVHTNPQAQNIGQSQLSALCHAMGHIGEVTDSKDLHYKPFEADVGIEPAKAKPGGGMYDARNRIDKYHFGGNTTAPVPPAANPSPPPSPPAPPPQRAAGGSRPWGNRR